jgi:hypothetical protein
MALTRPLVRTLNVVPNSVHVVVEPRDNDVGTAAPYIDAPAGWTIAADAPTDVCVTRLCWATDSTADRLETDSVDANAGEPRPNSEIVRRLDASAERRSERMFMTSQLVE